MLNDLFLRNDIIGASMQAASLRNEVIINNIANNDVPGFKKKGVQFESYLRSALDLGQIRSSEDLNSLSPSVISVDPNFSYRLDGNNVDPEQEMVSLYQNSMRYDTMTSSIINNYKRLNAVITGIK